MGWGSASTIFDRVADALIQSGANAEVTTVVLDELLRELTDGDWDTVDESVERYQNNPTIYAMFQHNGYGLPPDDQDDR